jgi:hypothetical protein
MGSSPGTVRIWQLDLGDPAWDVGEVAPRTYPSWRTAAGPT